MMSFAGTGNSTKASDLSVLQQMMGKNRPFWGRSRRIKYDLDAVGQCVEDSDTPVVLF